jgi:TolB-like protein/tetratricopeptide (TPR) repeat protein
MDDRALARQGMVFEAFHLDPVLRLLTQNGEPLALPPQIFDLLLFFLENPQRTLSKDELLQAIWPDRTVAEGSLTQAVFTLRKALKDGEGAGRYIVTSPGRGYRFVCTVRSAGEARATGAALSLASGAAATLPRPDPLLAVLAFDNLSGDPELAYFSDGVSQEILDTVARSSGLKVIGPSSSFQFRGGDKVVRKVAADLRATHLLDGSVRRAGSRVRISAHLVECASETTVWSERYEQELTDVFALQDEIAGAVAGALKTAFARSPPTPIDPAVFDLFLQARIPQRGFRALSERLELLEEVVARAPAFAQGWATLALLRGVALQVHRAEAAAAGLTRGQALAAADIALRHDPNMGLAYQALAWLEPLAAYRAREALQDRALAVAPNDAVLLVTAGSFYGQVGRLREGLAIALRAYELDPLSPAVMGQLGLQLLLARRIEESGRFYEAALARWPENERLAGNAIESAARRGDRARAQRLIGEWSEAAASNAVLREIIWFARNLLDPDATSIDGWIQEQRAELARSGTVSLNAPVRLATLGLANDAFELIDGASFAYMSDPESPMPATMYPGAIFLGSLPADPRFPGLCAKLGLCDYWIETGKWPDCADEVAYDFRAEARRLAGRPSASSQDVTRQASA